MRRLAVIAAAVLLSACAAPDDLPPNAPGAAPALPGSAPMPVGTRSCGGFRLAGSPPTCTANEYCHYTIADQCSAADAPGTCRPVPDACTAQYDPVCACNGKTYPNECEANADRTSAAYKGECA